MSQVTGVTLRGTEVIPRLAAPGKPVALIVSGSGPIDRDGNGANGLHTDAYRLLAAALGTAGVASVRYDKRGVGASGTNFQASELRLQGLVDDVRAWIDQLRKSSRFGRPTLIGHSEGGLVCTLAAQQAPVDALVLLSAAGRPLGALLKDQLSRQISKGALDDYDRIIASLRGGHDPDPIPAELATLFAPPTRTFIAIELDVDPGVELARVQNAAITISAGETDLQLSGEDAEALRRHRPDAKVALVPGMNHVLKFEAKRESPQASYVDPSRPLAPGLVAAVLASVPR